MRMKKRTLLVLMLIAPISFGATSPQKPITLSLNDAIYLALRYNVNLYSEELDRVVQKYNVVVAKNEFEPQYSIEGSVLQQWGKSRGGAVTATPSITLNNHWGTQFSLSMNNIKNWPDGSYSPSILFSVTQPLLKGFGKAVVDAALNDALDSERLNQLSFKNDAESTIVLIMNDYLTVVNDQENLQIDQFTLDSDETTLKNTKELVNAGRRAGVDLIQPQTDVAQQQSTIHKDIEILRNDEDKLLDDLGLSHDTEIQIPHDINFDDIAKQLKEGLLPSLSQGQQLALNQSVDYQGAVNTLRSSARALVSAKNGRLWDLSLKANIQQGGASGDTVNEGLNDLIDSRNYDQNIEADLTIPIDDVQTKQTLINAQISLEKANVALLQGARTLARLVSNQFHSLEDFRMQIQFSEHALKLQQETVRLAELQYNLGKISALDYSTQHKSLNTLAQSVIANKISYINALTQLTQTLGMTLDCFGVKIRY